MADMGISTHVLNAVTGRAAAGVPVRLEFSDDAAWVPVTEAATDADGRIPDLHPTAAAGVYRLHFDTGSYLAGKTFYPEVVITFRIQDPAEHHHVPLLLSPYGYSTYRGT